MEYEIVNLEEKIIVGPIAVTNNDSPDMGMIIGGLWEKFYQGGIYAGIRNKKNDKSMGIYTDYADDEKGDYSAMAACEVENAEQVPDGAAVRIIPGGKYAKFVVTGDMHKAVAEFWLKLWSMDLPRAYVCDFEEYQNGDMENAEIHIYIGLK